ncbi:uncharacterized protein RHO17_014433 isoform 1-T1 [Thomomys bottae]
MVTGVFETSKAAIYRQWANQLMPARSGPPITASHAPVMHPSCIRPRRDQASANNGSTPQNGCRPSSGHAADIPESRSHQHRRRPHSERGTRASRSRHRAGGAGLPTSVYHFCLSNSTLRSVFKEPKATM